MVEDKTPREAEFTPHSKEHPYVPSPSHHGIYRKQWVRASDVDEGDAKISADGSSLVSTCFVGCIAMILQNKATLDTALFHIYDRDLGLNLKQQEVLEQFMADYICSLDIYSEERSDLLSANNSICNRIAPKKYAIMSEKDFRMRLNELDKDENVQAKFVLGDRGIYSRKVNVVNNSLIPLGLPVLADIHVDVGGSRWGIGITPTVPAIFIDNRLQTRILEFPF